MTLWSDTYGPQQPLFMRVGYARAPRAQFVVGSLSSGVITVTCNGISYPVTLTRVGINAGAGGVLEQAGYVGSGTIVGLSQWTEYAWSATQGVNTITGSFRTLPGPDDSFSWYFFGCDNAYVPGAAYHTGHGALIAVRQQIESGLHPPCAGILFHDDLGYIARDAIDDTGDGGTGHVSTANPFGPSFSLEDYDYALGWFAYAGLLGDATQLRVAFGRNVTRVWLYSHTCIWPQWGDWEFANNLGFTAPTNNDPTSTAYHATYVAGVGQKDGAGYKSWGWFWAPLQPPALNAANSNAWAFALGCVQVAASDGITNGTGYVGAQAVDTQVTTVYGTAQIADLIGALSVHAPFKILSLSLGHQYLVPNPADYGAISYSGGTQSPVYNACPTEYAALFQDARSLSGLDWTNGTLGSLICTNGDYHLAHAYHHQIPGGTHITDFWELACGSVCHSNNRKFPVGGGAVVRGGTYNGTTVDWFDPLSGTGGANDYRSWGLRFDVYPGEPVRMVATIFDMDNVTLWTRTFTSPTYPKTAMSED